MSKTIAKRSVKAATKKSAIVKTASSIKAATRTTAKKTSAKKTVAKKVSAKKPAVRKPTAKKAAPKKAVAKKTVAKKVSARKPAVRKPRVTAKSAAIAELQQIKGIGAKFAEVLYNNGMKSLEMMSKMLKTDIERLSAKLKIGQRIGRENWVGQARKLVRANSKRK
jgi:predicted flap endonuclease-1-like 5' DNA nuclease